MKIVHVEVSASQPGSVPKGRLDAARLDRTTEADLATQQHKDDFLAAQDAAQFACHVRQRLGLTQKEFALRINVSLETIRNWEQGRRHPTGAAKALLKVLDQYPNEALEALG